MNPAVKPLYVRYGPWTTIGELRCGAIFETPEGVRAFKSSSYENCSKTRMCFGLDDGYWDWRRFPLAMKTVAREVILEEGAT